MELRVGFRLGLGMLQLCVSIQICEKNNKGIDENGIVGDF